MFLNRETDLILDHIPPRSFYIIRSYIKVNKGGYMASLDKRGNGYYHIRWYENGELKSKTFKADR